MRTLALLTCLTAPGWAADQARPETLHVYHLGNSLTRSLTLDRLHGLFAARGIDYQFGSQLSGGYTLRRHWEARAAAARTRQWETNQPAGATFLPGEPDNDPRPKRFGPYWQALAEHRWDAVVLQPYRSHLNDDGPAATALINFALDHGTAERFYLYQTWPRRRELNRGEDGPRRYEPLDYAAVWTQPYPHAVETARPTGEGFHSRDYTAKLLAQLNAAFAERLASPVRLIPVGEVWFVCDQRIRAGELPGLAELAARAPELVPGWEPAQGLAAGVNVFYADAVHPNPIPHLTGNVANYVNAMTLFSVLSGQTPVGLPASLYGLDETLDARLIQALQELVWAVVTSEPATGVG